LTPETAEGPGEYSDGRQDGRQSQLRSKLKDDENRLRELVTSYKRDSETIGPDSLEDVKTVIKRIYVVLSEDVEAQDGVLAEGTEIWTSLTDRYQQVFAATSKLRPILKRFKDLENEPGSAAVELDSAAGRMVDRRQEWLAKVTDFQQVFSAFCEELARATEKSA
jgi:hypothetical protein